MADSTQMSPQPFRLRYGLLVLALVLVIELDIEHISLSQIATTAYQNLANIAAINATVPPNEYNTLAAQFDTKDKELNAREQELIQREKDLDAKYQAQIAASKRTTIYLIGGATLVLVLLILANFYFDIKREEERERELKFSAEHGALPLS